MPHHQQPERGARHLVWSETRKAVVDLVETLSKGPSIEILVRQLDRLSREVDESPHGVVQVLQDLLLAGSLRNAVVSAAFIIRLGEAYASLVDNRILKVARARLRDGLEGQSDEDHAFVCMMLGMCTVPSSCILPLFSLMADSGSLCRYPAAIALGTVDPQAIERAARSIDRNSKRVPDMNISAIVNTLRSGLDARQDEAIQSMCAMALIRMMPESGGIIRQCMEALVRVKPELKFGILAAISHSECRDLVVVNALCALMRDLSLPSAIRGEAVKVLGSLAPLSPDVRSVLLEALRSEDVFIVRGAVHGNRLTKTESADTTEHYVRLLASENEELRRLGMEGIAHTSSLTESALAALLARLGEESSREESISLAQAVAAAGLTAMPRLIEIIKTGALNKRVAAVSAIAEMGCDGARVLFAAFRESSDELILDATAAVLSQLGAMAEPLVSELVDELERCTSGPKASLCVAGLYWSQTRNPVAARGLIAAALFAEDEVATFAERALRHIGVEVVPALQEALTETTEGDTVRLSRMLTEMLPPSNQSTSVPVRTGRPSIEEHRFNELREFNDDRRLRTFMYVARVWSRVGPLAFRDVASILEKDQRDGAIPGGYAIRVRTLGEHVKRVAGWAKDPIVTGTWGKTGGLTAEGKRLLQLIEVYFDAKYGSRM